MHDSSVRFGGGDGVVLGSPVLQFTDFAGAAGIARRKVVITD